MQKELNLVPYHLRENQEKQKKKQDFIMKCSLIGVTLIIGSGLMFLYRVSLESKSERLKAQIFSKQQSLIEKSTLISDIDLLDDHLQKVESLKSTQDPKTDDAISELLSLVPEDVVLKKLSYNDESVTIEGNSNTLESVENFWANLRENKKFNKSHINTIVNSNGYNISCVIKLKTGDEINASK